MVFVLCCVSNRCLSLCLPVSVFLPVRCITMCGTCNSCPIIRSPISASFAGVCFSRRCLFLSPVFVFFVDCSGILCCSWKRLSDRQLLSNSRVINLFAGIRFYSPESVSLAGIGFLVCSRERLSDRQLFSNSRAINLFAGIRFFCRVLFVLCWYLLY